jgi:hypothetical protein
MIIIREKTRKNEALNQKILDILNSLPWGGGTPYREVQYEGGVRFNAQGGSRGMISAYYYDFNQTVIVDVVSQWAITISVKDIVNIVSSNTKVSFILKNGKIDLIR